MIAPLFGKIHWHESAPFGLSLYHPFERLVEQNTAYCILTTVNQTVDFDVTVIMPNQKRQNCLIVVWHMQYM